LNDSVIVVGCFTSIDGVTNPADQIDVTCLSAADRTFIAGMNSPGTKTFEINVDPTDASHVRLHELKGTTLKWAIGWSDAVGTDPTVDSSGDFVLPTTRTWLDYEGFITDYPFSFAVNSVVKSSISVQISGAITFTPKV